MTKLEFKQELHKIFPEWAPLSNPFYKINAIADDYAEDMAIAFKEWCSNQITAGRITNVLWSEFKQQYKG